MKINHTNKKLNSRLIIVIVSVVVLTSGIILYVLYAHSASLWPFYSSTTANDTLKTDTSDGINYNPPTQQEIDSSQDAKDRNGEDNSPKVDPNTNLKMAEVGVAFADVVNNNFEIRAFTPSVIEGTGVCTATLTHGSLTVSSETKAFIDSSTSQCQPIIIPLNKFSQPGTWQLVVGYASSTSSGQSEIIEVEIP